MIVAMLEARAGDWEVVGPGRTNVHHEAPRAASANSRSSSRRPKVFVLTLKAGACGVTLTAATRLYLFEPCLDPSHEIQAAGRVHRLGQLRRVTRHPRRASSMVHRHAASREIAHVEIVHFVYKQTIERAICELHDKVRANQIQIIDGTYSTRALRLLK